MRKYGPKTSCVKDLTLETIFRVYTTTYPTHFQRTQRWSVQTDRYSSSSVLCYLNLFSHDEYSFQELETSFFKQSSHLKIASCSPLFIAVVLFPFEIPSLGDLPALWLADTTVLSSPKLTVIPRTSASIGLPTFVYLRYALLSKQVS